MLPVIEHLKGRGEAISVAQVAQLAGVSVTTAAKQLRSAINAGLVERRWCCGLPGGKTMQWGYYLTLTGASSKGAYITHKRRAVDIQPGFM